MPIRIDIKLKIPFRRVVDAGIQNVVGELLSAQRCFLSNQLALIKQLALAYMGPVTGMQFAGGTVGAQGHFAGFIMGAALGTTLLTVASFWIWHINGYYKCSIIIYSMSLKRSKPFQMGFSEGGGGVVSVRFNHARACGLQKGPSISSKPQLFCMGKLRLMNS